MSTEAVLGKWNAAKLAARVAADLPDGSYVNLGIGMPTAVADYVVPDKEIVFHSENGILGFGAAPAAGEEDPDLINAGKQYVTFVPGSAILGHSESFALIRGGHLDVAVMGAFQVSAAGDLANWTTGRDGVPAVGGAMDLAAGAREVWVMMKLLGPDGAAKLVQACALPLTAAGVVQRVYTDMGIFAIGPGGMTVEATPDGITRDYLANVTGLPLR